MLNHLLNFAYSYSYDYGYNYDDSYSTIGDAAGEAAGAAAVFGLLGVMLLIGLLPTILMVIAQWKIFKKCGEDGWKAIIPIYNMITLLKIVKIRPLWILVAFIPVVGGIGMAILGIVAIIRLCKGFDKSDGFIVGTILLSLIFQLILAFDKSTWDASRIDLNSFSFLNDPNATVDPAGAAAKSAGEAPKTSPQDPWVNGEEKK